MVVAGILLIAVPFLLFTAGLPWANSRQRRLVHGTTAAFRFTIGWLVVLLLCCAVALGLFTKSIGPPLTMVGLSALSLVVTALAMSDGTLLPRDRPLDPREIRWLWRLPGVAGLLGVAIAVDAAISRHQPPVALLGAGFAAAVGAGAFAIFSMLRS